jgi:putative tryptophan/tyrosine transport system substrate-binding protein
MKKAAASSLLIAVALVAFPVIAEAQQPKKLPRLRYLVTGSGRGLNGQAFEQGLRALGYVEGQNIVIERRWAGGNLDRSLTVRLNYCDSR